MLYRRRLQHISTSLFLTCWTACNAVLAAGASPVHATWVATPVCDVSQQIGRLAKIPVILDRRINPTTPISIEASGESSDVILAQVAKMCNAQIVYLRSSIRITPPQSAGRCVAAETLRNKELNRLASKQKQRLLHTEAWSWPSGSQPRNLLEALVQKNRLTIPNMNMVPHDHFPAADIPPIPLADRLDLLLAHFDLRVAWAPNASSEHPSGMIVALPKAPETAMAKPSRSTSRPQQPQGRKVFTLRLEAPLEPSLVALTKQLGLTLELDRATLTARGISPQEIARADVTQVSREKLLDAILKPLGISWQIRDTTLRVWAEVPKNP
ncbi:MAG: hypothetical protein ABGW78_07465 [Pirellulales bacterium]